MKELRRIRKLEIETYLMKRNSILYLASIKNKIDTSPEYQRQGDLWNLEKKQLFLDSIFNNFDIPKLYLHVLWEPYKKENNMKLYSVIDGKQRLETLWSFIENEIPLGELTINYRNKLVDLTGLKYHDLAEKYPTLLTYFDDYPLPIVGVTTPEDDEEPITEMFSRLNEAVSINAAEKRNAIGGKMVKIIRKITSQKFFKENVTITNKRYQHHEVSARLLFLEYCIRNRELRDTKKPYLDQFVKDFKTKSPDPGIHESVITILDFMSRTFSKHDALLKRQSRVPIYYLLFRQGKKQGMVRDISRDRIKNFVKKVEENKKEAQVSLALARPELIEYDRLSIQGTNDSSSIRQRFHIIARYFHMDTSEIDNL